MRINKFIASATTLSRRAADVAITAGRVRVDGVPAQQGMDISESSKVTLDNRAITPAVNTITIMFNKPRGYVVSRDGQGSETIYDILPAEYHQLNPVGRLDKDTSGLLLLTNDGELANQLTHPKYQKSKVYEVVLDKPLQPLHQQMIADMGVQLEDGPSQFLISKIDNRAQHGHERVASGGVEATLERSNESTPRGARPSSEKNVLDAVYEVTLHEGRNRQIRRTFAALGYTVTRLHRTQFGNYTLSGLAPREFKSVL